MLGPVLICESRICELLFRQIMNSKVPIREASSFSDGDAPQGPTTATGGPQVALNKIFHHIANNTVPESIRHALCSINYTILEKANGKFRPVGTDSIFNKVVNRALLEQQQPHIAHLLQASPELAVGVKDGISAAVGMAFGELQACESTPGWTMLSLDFKSAFNYTDRARLHEIVADKVPGLLRAFERHYARPTTHCIVDKFFKVIDIDVGQGIVQGNELSPFFFALYSCGVLGLRDATTDYRCKVIKYLDDIVLMGPAEDVAADVEIIKARAESAGLHLQPTLRFKHLIYYYTGMTVLGTPIGRREWMKKQLNDKAKHIAGKLNDMLTTGVSLQALLTAMQYVPSLINHLYTLPPSLTSGLSELLNRACKDTFVKAFFAKVNLSAPAGAEGHDVTLEQLLEARLFTRANTGGFGLHDLVERGPVAYVCNMAKLAIHYPRVYDRLLEDESRAADFEAHVQRAGFQMATVKDAATQRPAEIIALRSKAALDDLMAKCALDLQQAYLASREWGVSTVLTMRGRDKLRRLSDTTFAIAVVSMMGFGLHELINVKPTDKCPLCSSKTPQPRLTREHLLTCRPIKRHNALRDEMGRLLRPGYASSFSAWAILRQLPIRETRICELLIHQVMNSKVPIREASSFSARAMLSQLPIRETRICELLIHQVMNSKVPIREASSFSARAMLSQLPIRETRICELLFRQIMNSKVPIREASSFSSRAMLSQLPIRETRICELLIRQVMNSKVPIREASSFSARAMLSQLPIRETRICELLIRQVMNSAARVCEQLFRRAMINRLGVLNLRAESKAVQPRRQHHNGTQNNRRQPDKFIGFYHAEQYKGEDPRSRKQKS
ncbi:uncharacterized protein MONBRDRAFT_8287 [Monosiga brevicollis MX1]|uniref:Reverse transcriptase domain-containing protein n=1 Tax=Monosiga brevicollis TaxID=81824 RepID=A9UZL4_MONBE|nr:uncharacterized protein MONBRDRAFT_8287 [Monosiga brevicollis MX1]EDQ89251.1 predicted protein [Monosiga brevicollis MX1]|eukprot:XP_001745827.1 hypothetical protein [Monosiga brevicollis MX1]